MDAQRKLMEADMDVRSEDILTRQIVEAKAEFDADPEVPGKIMKYVDALVRSEVAANEATAVEVLSNTFERTKQFRFRLAVGKIKLMQLARQERALREKLKQNPSDDAVKEEYREFMVNKNEEELKEYTLWAENYPTDLTYKYEMAKRLFTLQRFSEAIPVLQTARQDPKVRAEATIFLSRSFLEASFVDEAVETMRALIEDYPVKGDVKSKEMYYWYARALEQQNDTGSAIKAYSQLAQWDFNYRDVQTRIKRLRSGGNGGAAPTA
jgi:tetratricopeptide (TPR) repeat protein